MKRWRRLAVAGCLLGLSILITACGTVPTLSPTSRPLPAVEDLTPLVGEASYPPPPTPLPTAGPTPIPTITPLPTALPLPPSPFYALWAESIVYEEFGQPGGTIWLADPGDVTSRREIVHVDQGIVQAILSPNRQHIAFITNPGHGSGTPLWVVNMDGTNLRQLAPDASQLFWSRNNQAIAYKAIGEEQISIEYVDLASGVGQQVLTTDLSANTWLVGWSANGQWLYYTQRGTEGYDLWAVRADGSGTRSLGPLGPELPQVGYLLLSPDGGKLLIGTAHGLRWRSVEDQQGGNVPLPRTDRGYLLQWDGTGGEAVVGMFDDQERAVVVDSINVHTGKSRRLGHFRSSGYGRVALGISPDYKWFVNQESTGTYFIYLPDGIIVPVPEANRCEAFISWVPRGTEP